ncbi:peroxisomal sarcosine oxidase-like [Amphiura filiformis]|uniref:peroxisomal sarcosine oxidase-like n=1 Tax=Amphiura filiformis TaxID=82378 RepID=UPI003B20DD41
MADCVVYDICVVGAGLWGSAAAYHASMDPETKVCLIGPDEPTTKQEFTERTVFGAHYDEARITRQNVGNMTDAEIARRSHDGFGVLESKTGVSFYNDCSHILFGKAKSPYVISSKKTSEFLGLEHLLLSNDELSRMFPYLTLGDGNECLLQLSNCGMVNPRRLVSAQKLAASSQGCDIVTSIVNQINEKYDQVNRDTILEVVTEDGHMIQSRRVLICTGGFTLSKPLLPPHLLPDLRLAPTQTLRIELSAEDTKTLREMPMISSIVGGNNIEDCYMCPPVTYPDGRTYLKIGHGRRKHFERNDAIAEWYRSKGDPIITEKMNEMLNRYIPGLQPLSTQIDTCVLSGTPSGLPYIDMITPEIGIAVGGNGVGARWSYEVGKIAAKMMTKGQWDYDLPKEYFKVQLARTRKDNDMSAENFKVQNQSKL